MFSNRQKIELLLNKYPEVKFNRGLFWWKWFEEFHDVRVVMGKRQWLEFYPEFSGTERELRNVLKDPEFKLPPEAEAKRYEKASVFKQEYKAKFQNTLEPQEKQDFLKTFGSESG